MMMMKVLLHSIKNYTAVILIIKCRVKCRWYIFIRKVVLNSDLAPTVRGTVTTGYIFGTNW